VTPYLFWLLFIIRILSVALALIVGILLDMGIYRAFAILGNFYFRVFIVKCIFDVGKFSRCLELK
jgi:hypothetical protein